MSHQLYNSYNYYITIIELNVLNNDQNKSGLLLFYSNFSLIGKNQCGRELIRYLKGPIKALLVYFIQRILNCKSKKKYEALGDLAI